MKPEEVRELIERGVPGARVKVTDLTGTGDHFSAEVVAERFAGKSMLEQHRMVYAALGARMGGAIHALQLDTRAK
jgi:stress-induced morphogen